MLLHIALGDAYGAGFEFAPARDVRTFNDLSGYRQHPKHLGVGPGRYTDDTQMSLAVAEAMLETPSPRPLDWVRHFLDAFQRDPRAGYAKKFHEFLKTVTSPEDFMERIKPDSAKSGAAMRALPIGYYSTPEEVFRVAAEQARLTHDTQGGVQAAQAVALTAHYFLYHLGPRKGVAKFLADWLGGCWTDWQGPVGHAGMDTARAALTAIVRNDSLATLLRECVEYTGDVDTVASLALGAATCCWDYRRDLPAVLWDNLEDGPFGKTYLTSIQAKLDARFPTPSPRATS